MALLQPKLNLKISQRQILTPGLMQMVSVLALNKLELKEMIDAEMVENPVLEEIDETVPMLDEVAGREQRLERGVEEQHSAEEPTAPPQDPFNEIDFGTYFQDYLDPGFRTQPEYEDNEKPSFENFLSQPTTLADHLAWQLGALTLDPGLHEAVEFIIGNLDEDGYVAGSEEELTEAFSKSQDEPEKAVVLQLLHHGIDLVQQLDPAGVGARDLRECLLIQIVAQQHEFAHLFTRQPVEAGKEEDVHRSFRAEAEARIEERRRSIEVAALIVDRHLHLLQKRDVKDLARACQITPAEAHAGIEFIRTLDPRPGRQYNREQSRLIEPDVVFVKRDDAWVVSMNEEDMPSLRLSRRYRQMLSAQDTDKEVKEYVKERFRSALQLMRNIAQRKSTILRTCEVIVRRQHDFLEAGIEALRPMMIKEVAEEIGVHPSTVSRAVANKYAHTPQGVLELRFFFSEGSNGPEGADTPLLVLKRKVRKLIAEEDARHPLTDDQLASMLQAQGIQLTRRTVAKYREDMNIPSTHQRRQRDG
jgi:RNA polymerase sigma-54 factor